MHRGWDRPWLAAALVLWYTLSPAGASAQRALTVTIDSPEGGVVDVHGSVLSLSASVSDPSVRTAIVTAGGASYEVPVEGARIMQDVVVAPGPGRVAVTVRSGDRVASASVTYYARGERTELLVLATWPSRGEIVDLWVREPSGETCKWDHRRTGSGGRLLDFSGDAIGFGSQAYVLGEVSPGTYRIKLHYWSQREVEDEGEGPWDYETLLEELDRLTAMPIGPGVLGVLQRREIAEAERLLDRWATAAAPQVAVRVEAIAFPGSRFERRFRFERRVQAAGHLATLGEIEIDEALIAAARRAQLEHERR